MKFRILFLKCLFSFWPRSNFKQRWPARSFYKFFPTTNPIARSKIRRLGTGFKLQERCSALANS